MGESEGTLARALRDNAVKALGMGAGQRWLASKETLGAPSVGGRKERSTEPARQYSDIFMIGRPGREQAEDPFAR